MQEHGQWRFANQMGLLLLVCTALATSGCASAYHVAHYNWLATFEQSVMDHHRSYFHSGRTGRIIAKTHRHSIPVEPDCFGYEPTCWYNWPSHCVNCPPPDQIVEEEVVEPPPMQQVPEQAPQQQNQGDGLDGLLDLDDPQPGEQPILPNRGRGASAVPPASIRQVAPEPRSSSRSGLSVTKQETLDDLMHDKVVTHVEAESPNVAAYKAAISRRSINQRMELVETVRPERVNRDDRPLAFVDSGAEVDNMTPAADVSLPNDTRPAPPAIAPSVVQSAPEQTAPSLVQAASTPGPHGTSSRRTIRFAPATATDEVTVVDKLSQAVESQVGEVVDNTRVEPQAELIVREQPVQAVQNDPPMAPRAEPVQMAKNELPETLNEEPAQEVQDDISLPSFQITAVAPASPEKQVKMEATKPSATIRFVSGKQPKAVRVSARDLTRGEDSSDLKFR